MQSAYIQVVVLLHVAFGGVFFFLFRQSASRFARLFAASWLIEALRAAIQLPGVRALGGSPEHWFAVSDVTCFLANWWLLAGCATLAGVTLPRWLGRCYFGISIPLVLFNRYFLGTVATALTGVPEDRVRFYGILANLIIMFVPVALTRTAILVWLVEIWRRSHLPGALVAGVFCVPYALVALAVPFQFYFSWGADWISVLWCARVLGFSIGMVVLMLNLQQQAAKKSEARLAAAQALAKIGSWEQDFLTNSVMWSAEMFRLYGRDPKHGVMSREDFLAAIHPRDRETFLRNEAASLQERRSVEHEFRIVRPDSSMRWVHGRTTQEFTQTGKLLRQIGVEQDVTERKKREAQTALQHAVTRVLAEAQPLPATLDKILEIIGRGLGAEFAACWTLERGRSALRCAHTWHTAEPAVGAFAALSRTMEYQNGHGLPGRVWAERQPVFVERGDLTDGRRYPRRDAADEAGLRGGCGFPIVLRTEIFGVVEFFTPESTRFDAELMELFAALGTQIGQFVERQRLEDQYRQSQKMEAVGTLAGGIAHDFNNVLTGISGYCELAQMELPPDAPAATHLQAVRAGAKRAAELVRQIMAFSRQQSPQRQPIVLSRVVDEAMRLLRATIPATVEIKTQYEGGLPCVLADATSIHQIVVNLCTNACHAMRDRPGRLEVSLMSVTVDQDFAQAHPGLKIGRYVQLGVADTGSGMDAATVARIFEPFFTTKAPGEGTGLGLSVVHGIVQSHDGGIFVYSQPGEGTRFRIYLPEHGGEAMVEAEALDELPRGRGERVLYVEDEPQLALMGRQMLVRLGYTPEVRERPLEALALLRAQPAAFELLVTDLTMPEMTGLELARRARKIRPGLPVVLMSGYASTLSLEKLEGLGVGELLTKPHSLAAFARAIEKVRRRTAGPAS